MNFNASGKRLRQGFLGYKLVLLPICTSSTMHKFREKFGEINAVYIDMITNWLTACGEQTLCWVVAASV